jgi:uncharacterized glyoxalase superfamily protein PhnB
LLSRFLTRKPRYLHIDDIESFYAATRASGAEISKPIRDEPWGMREFGVITIDGHRIMFGTPISL